MNLVDCTVIKVIGKPYSKYDRWFIDVKYEAYGHESLTFRSFATKEEAEQVKIGDVFLC